MSDYMGDESAVAVQQSIRNRIGDISANPLLSNGGRILNILDPEAFGWDGVRREVGRYGVVGLTMVDPETTLARLASEFGEDMAFPFWEAFRGTPEEVMPACEAILAGTPLPQGWYFSHDTCPDEATIEASQALNMETGVMPAPAYYLRSEHVPSLLSCLWTEDGTLVACASATMRYHPDGPLGGWLFAGSVSVSPARRWRGLGSLVNAALLVEARTRFGWSHVLEQAKASNAPSVGMIRRCGLRNDPRRVTIGVNPTGGFTTR